jgi:ABC-type uncharacterized transport system permease subunit
MKKLINGLIIFVFCIGWGYYSFTMVIQSVNKGYSSYDSYNDTTTYHTYFDEDNFILYSLVLISVTSTILYLIWTKFGYEEKVSELKKVEIENDILKLKIEQKEIMEKLTRFNT